MNLPLAQTTLRADSNPIPLVMAIIMALMTVIVFFWFLTRYRRCPANKIMVISGKTGMPGDAPRCVRSATFVWPVVQRCDFLDLTPFTFTTRITSAATQDGVPYLGSMGVTAAISRTPEMASAAANRLLGMSTEAIQAQASELVLGQVRSMLAGENHTGISRDWQAFTKRATDSVAAALGKLGLEVVNVTVELKPKAALS